MSKKKLQVLEPGQVGFVRIGEIATFNKLNSRVSLPKDDSALVNLFASHPEGWDRNYTIEAMPFDGLPDDEPERDTYTVDEILNGRKAILENLEANVKGQASAVELAVRKAEWCEDDGSLIEPLYLNNTCFRRLNALHRANVVRYRNDKELILRVPVNVMRFLDHVTRVQSNLRENTIAKEGDAKLSVADLFKAARTMYEHGAKQIDFRPEKHKDGETQEKSLFGSKGQAFYYACKLHQTFKSADFIGRLTSEREGDHVHPKGYLDWAKFNNANLGEAINLAPAWTPDDFEAWLETATTKGSNVKKMLDNKTVTAIGQIDNDITATLLNKGVLAGDATVSGYVRAIANASNYVHHAYEHGYLAEVTEALKRIHDEWIANNEPVAAGK